MHAAILHAFGEALSVEEREPPTPTDGETLVRVRAVGLCGTDLKLCAGQLGPRIALPLIPGHEVAGEIVESRGPLAPGTRVTCYVYEACGTCALCAQGRTTLCPESVRIGLERDGGLAEYAALPTENLIAFSDDVSFEAAAVAMDSVTAPWAALHGAGAVRAGERVVVLGAGGLGLNAVQIAVAEGADVAVVDILPEGLERATALGASLAVQPRSMAEIVDWSDGGADLLIEAAGAAKAFSGALSVVRPGGRVVLCGYQPGVPYQFDSMAVVLGELMIRGSRNATLEQARAAMAAVERGDIVPVVSHRFPLTRVNEGLAQLRAGGAGRVVIEP